MEVFTGEVIFTAYSEEAGITTIFKDIYIKGDLKSCEVVGFYYGYPEDEATKKFNGRMVAKFQ